jgi:hypothetical protein
MTHEPNGALSTVFFFSPHYHLYQYSNTLPAMHKYTFAPMRSMVEKNAVNDARNPHLGVMSPGPVPVIQQLSF